MHLNLSEMKHSEWPRNLVLERLPSFKKAEIPGQNKEYYL